MTQLDCHVYFAILPVNIFSSDILDLSCSFIAQVSFPYNEALRIFSFRIIIIIIIIIIIFTERGDLRMFWISVNNSIIWRNFYILTVISFSFWHKTEQPRETKVFMCSIILLLITMLLLTGSLHIKVIDFVFLFEIFLVHIWQYLSPVLE